MLNRIISTWTLTYPSKDISSIILRHTKDLAVLRNVIKSQIIMRELMDTDRVIFYINFGSIREWTGKVGVLVTSPLSPLTC